MKGYLQPIVHCSTVYNNQDMEVTQMSNDRGIYKENVIHIYVYIYTHTHTHTHTYNDITQPLKNEIIPFETMWMDLEVVILSEINQTEKKYHTTPLIWNLPNLYNICLLF